MQMDLFKNKYRIPPARLQAWNYANEGLYFVTICTLDKENFLGEIVEGEIYLSEIGKIAEEEWLNTKEFRKDMNLRLEEYVIMPNHIHGIISIGENIFNEIEDEQLYQNTFIPQSKNLSSVIRGYKSSVTIYARHHEIPFGWQTRFYDHIIRSADSHLRIADYILNNVSQWKEDSLYK